MTLYQDYQYTLSGIIHQKIKMLVFSIPVARAWHTTLSRWCARAGVTSLPGCCQSVRSRLRRAQSVCVCVRVCAPPHRVRVSEWTGVFAFAAFTRSLCNAERKTRQGKRFYCCCGDLCRRSGLAHCASSRQDDSLDPTAAGNVTSRLNSFIATQSARFIVLVLRSC